MVGVYVRSTACPTDTRLTDERDRNGQVVSVYRTRLECLEHAKKQNRGWRWGPPTMRATATTGGLSGVQFVRTKQCDFVVTRRRLSLGSPFGLFLAVTFLL
jgi:hypothetical protein